MNRRLIIVLLAVASLVLQGCMRWDYGSSEPFESPGAGLFVLNEGNFQYGNSTLTFYDPETRQCDNEIFIRANGMKLGDVGQSMTLRGNELWIVVNNSHVVFAIDATTFKEVGRIGNLTSPRYIHFISDTKAYISQLWDNRIAIANPSTRTVTGYITVPDMTMGSGSTEQMVQVDGYVYCNCWSYQDKIIKIDTATDEVVGQLHVGVQPQCMVLDRNGKLWVLTDGGFPDNPAGYESPKLLRIDPATLTIEHTFTFKKGSSPRALAMDGDARTLYWLNDDVWSMDISSTRLPVRPLLKSRGTIYRGLTVDPAGGDIYVADAIDYQQQGIVFRYSADGATLLDQFYVGITPQAFCWK